MDQFPEVYRAFHPKDPARGMRNYDIGALTIYQKRKLNSRKAAVRYENEIYLATHPEIKGFISLVLKQVVFDFFFLLAAFSRQTTYRCQRCSREHDISTRGDTGTRGSLIMCLVHSFDWLRVTVLTNSKLTSEMRSEKIKVFMFPIRPAVVFLLLNNAGYSLVSMELICFLHSA